MNRDYIVMINQATLDLEAQNRRSEKTELPYAQIALRLGQANYQDLIQWLLETCDSLSLFPATRFLARVYLDECLWANQDPQVLQGLTLAVACLSIAIKFNQRRETADRLTPDFLLMASDTPIERDAYFALELQVLTTLRLRFKRTTPYDYFPVFFARFPWMGKAREAIGDILHMAIALPEACGYSAEELFYASLWATFEYKQVRLTQLQMNVFDSATPKWERAREMGERILVVIRAFFQPEAQF